MEGNGSVRKLMWFTVGFTAVCGIGAYLVAVLLLVLMYFSNGNLWLLPAAVSAALSGTKVLCED